MRWRRALFELHHQLRTEGGTPTRNAVAVGLGAFLGCFPVYGVHLFLCAVAARLLRVSRVRTYLASHINNPLTFGPLTLLELGVGRWLTTGAWPALSLEGIGAGGLLSVGRDLAIGSLAVGVLAGTTFGAVAWVIGLRWSAPRFEDTYREALARRYTRTGIFDWEYVRAKLRLDPIHRLLLRSGALDRTGTMVDLGCGRGLLFASIDVARRMVLDGRWPETWARPPAPDRMIGADIHRRRVRAARRAVGNVAEFRLAALERYDPPPCRTAVLVDVLHDLAGDDQEALIARLANRIEPGGRIVVREIDDGAGWPARWARFPERLSAIAHGVWRPRFRFRSATAWVAVLERCGFRVERIPGGRRGEVLLAAIRPDPGRRERTTDLGGAGRDDGGPPDRLST